MMLYVLRQFSSLITIYLLVELVNAFGLSPFVQYLYAKVER